MEKITAWHFSEEDKLSHGDGRPIVAGKTLRVRRPIILCHRGLHASERAIDALRYAMGTMVSRVELFGEVQRGDDKIVATHRKTLWIADSKMELRTFARLCALRVAHLWDVPGIVMDWLNSGNESHREAALSEAQYALNNLYKLERSNIHARYAALSAVYASVPMAWSGAYSAAYAESMADNASGCHEVRHVQNERLEWLLLNLGARRCGYSR